MSYNPFHRFVAAVMLLGVFGVAIGVLTGKWPSAAPVATDASLQNEPSSPAGSRSAAKPDLSGRKRTGEASYYAKKFTGRTMADGTPMDPEDDNAASKTLPLGTTAKVTNLETGQSANVTIQDRGPYVKGRIIDLSPSTAREIGLDPQAGTTKVVVAPIAVPLPDGRVKQGAAAGGNNK